MLVKGAPEGTICAISVSEKSEHLMFPQKQSAYKGLTHFAQITS